jgi:hypothetical protein
MTPSSDNDALQRRVTRLTGLVGVLAILWIATVLWVVFRGATIPSTIVVERLEIREPDGHLAFALANSARPTVGTMDGEVIMADQAEDRRFPHFIFFDGKGDEVGGMMMRESAGEDGPNIARFMTFDGYQHQETVVLGYTHDPNGTVTGLRVIDHLSGVSLLEALAKLGLEPGFTRDDAAAAIETIPAEERQARMRELTGSTRVVVGSRRDSAAVLELNDGNGRPRIVLEVPADGQPSIRVLDVNGEAVLRLPR